MDKEIKQTQGNRKMRQYLEDLFRNDVFIKKLKMIMGQHDANWFAQKHRISKAVKDVQEAYDKYKEKGAEYLKIQKELRSTMPDELALEYGLDMRLLWLFVGNNFKVDKKELELDNYIDVCALRYHDEEYFSTDFPPPPFEIDLGKQNHLKVFPVSINIHKFATKRDVIDYIEKKWPRIEERLSESRGNKNVRFRQRKIDRKVSDFIWENKGKPIMEIVRGLNEKFPNNHLVYYEIYKIISLERARRTKKLNVGQ